MSDRHPPYDFEILVKSFLRFDKLLKLVHSARKHYPGVVIRVADDSPESPEREAAFRQLDALGGCVIDRLPENVGISVGRNAMVREVGTPYFVLSDDDAIFTRRTSIEKLRAVLEADADSLLAAGVYLDYGFIRRYQHGHIEREGPLIRRFLYGDRAPRVMVGGIECIRAGLTSNFFLAKTAVFRTHNITWDERLKINEHMWFFLNLPPALHVYVVPGVTIAHYPTRWGRRTYRAYRYHPVERRRLSLVEKNLRGTTIRIHESPAREFWGSTQRWLRRKVDQLTRAHRP